jgi:hypothetical protein
MFSLQSRTSEYFRLKSIFFLLQEVLVSNWLPFFFQKEEKAETLDNVNDNT